MSTQTSAPGSAQGVAARVRPLRQLLPFLYPYRKIIVLAALTLLVATLATLAIPFTARYLIDHGLSATNASAIDRYFAALLGVATVMAVAVACRHYLVSWLGERVVADVRKAVYGHVITMDPVFFETTRSGEVLSRLTTDTTLIQTVVGSTVSMALRNVLMVIGGLVMLVLTSPKLAGLIVGLIPLIVVPIAVFGRSVRRLSRHSQDRIADVSALAGEVLNGIQVVQAFTYEAQATARYDGAVEQAFDAARRRLRARAVLTGLVIFLVFAAAVFLLWNGAQAVLAGELSPGQLGQFVLYAMMVGGAAGVLSEVWGELQRAAGATERLMELLHCHASITSPNKPQRLPQPLRGRVTFEDVTFHYPSRPQQAALADFSLTVEAGQTIALVGPSGAGKTTVFQLLLRFYDPQHGTIRLDDVPITALALQDLRASIALVPQDTVIFAADALENIRYGRPDASDEQVYRAAQLAAADGFLAQLPNGYHTFLGERGLRLSGGQRQRIAIARAILKDSPVLLLDEATSALDAESEQEVQHALARLAQDRTTLVIAHRLATVLRADRIVVLDHGGIVATGTHEELIRQEGLYRQLAALQFAL